MRSMKGAWVLAVLVLLARAGGPAAANASGLPAAQQSPAPDNTKANAGDQSKATPTADRQKENASDLDITRRIRRAIITDKSLSTYAHNVKVVTQDGLVTLRGPVRSEEERDAIEAKAKEIAGNDKVTNELAVKPKS